MSAFPSFDALVNFVATTVAAAYGAFFLDV